MLYKNKRWLTATVPITVLMCMLTSILFAQPRNDKSLDRLLRKHASAALLNVLNNPNTYQFQLIYTRINRDKDNKPRFKYYHLNTDPNRYFYPASTVKLPTALVALDKLNRLKVNGLDKNSVMLTDSSYAGQTSVLKDTSSQNGLPSIAHYIKKIFLVSDNDAYNRLYEFVGQKHLNETLISKGYSNTRILKRLVPASEEENKHTNPIRFFNDGKLVYQQKEQISNLQFNFGKKVELASGFYRGQTLVNEPMDFTRHNRFPLEEQQQVLQSLMFPESTAKIKFELNKDDYTFLYKYMSMPPSQSDYPKYNPTDFFDNYVKFFWWGEAKSKIPDHIKIFNKAGMAYGFLIDNAYIIDLENKVEFMITAVIYTNKDGILNDDKYDYDEIGFPFFNQVGDSIYKHELKRKRKFKPDFNF
jgi:hypothetical protein